MLDVLRPPSIRSAAENHQEFKQSKDHHNTAADATVFYLAVLPVLPPVLPLFIIELMLAFSQPKIENNLNSPIFLQQMWKCKYVETSAKEGTNVNELFEELLKLETSRTLRWSTWVLVYFTWLLDHVTNLKMRKFLLLLQAEQFHKITTTHDRFE